MPWIALPAEDEAGEVQRLVAAYRHSRAVAAELRACLPMPGHAIVPGVDCHGRSVVYVDGVPLVLNGRTSRARNRTSPDAA